MENEKIYEGEEIWSAIRYLDPDEPEKDKQTDTDVLVATFAILLIVVGVWGFLWLR